MGTRSSLVVELASATEIPLVVLQNGYQVDARPEIAGEVDHTRSDRMVQVGLCVAERLSWASKRRVTREEDRAYSLMVSGSWSLDIPSQRLIMRIGSLQCEYAGSVWGRIQKRVLSFASGDFSGHR